MASDQWLVTSKGGREWEGWKREKQWNATALVIHSLAGKWGRMEDERTGASEEGWGVV